MPSPVLVAPGMQAIAIVQSLEEIQRLPPPKTPSSHAAHLLSKGELVGGKMSRVTEAAPPHHQADSILGKRELYFCEGDEGQTFVLDSCLLDTSRFV